MKTANTPGFQDYLVCALWSSTQDDSRPVDDDFDVDDFAPEAIEHASKEYEAFETECANDAELQLLIDMHGMPWTPEQFGHDFWLTRNGHGAGFWDRYLGAGREIRDASRAMGKILTRLADQAGPSDIYVGDDGKLYFA